MKQKMFNKIMIFAAFVLAANLVFSFSGPVLADDDPRIFWGGDDQKQYIEQNSGLPSGDRINDPRRLVAEVIKVILGFLGIIAVIIILYAGFKWMTSGGNEETVGDAKKMLIAGLIGLIIIVLAYVIANFVINQIVEITA